MGVLEDVVVVPPASRVICPVDDQTVRVDRQLCLDGVSPLLSRIVGSSLLLVLGAGNLLFGRVYECPEFGIVLLDLFQRSQSPCQIVYLLRYRNALPHERLYVVYIPTNVALVKVEKITRQEHTSRTSGNRRGA